MFNEELFCLLSEKDNIPNRSLCNKNYSKSKGYKDRIKKQKLQRRLSNNLRSRIRHSVISKNQKSLDLTGCSIEQLMAHLESKFSDGMTWENYGEWHIDHIKPCAKFDLTLESEQEKCFHFSNLQPLWAEENFKKGSS